MSFLTRDAAQGEFGDKAALVAQGDEARLFLLEVDDDLPAIRHEDGEGDDEAARGVAHGADVVPEGGEGAAAGGLLEGVDLAELRVGGR